ncbi:Tex family protein [Defluviitalea phaphyphila]|uniref:Tex family protein n=1 Tax=Defluviitalea phaphyphila TaxID=1473580 RepID=UPI0007315D3F|nr:Tex family protein [Defluviitalea phaphyphila]
MDIIKKIEKEFKLKPFQVKNTIQLIDEGNTIPFIARYRKEATGSLDDVTLRNFYDRLNYLRNLEEKKEQIIRSIEEQGKLTDELINSLEKAETITELEDIYRPYRPKRRTRATIAKEKGLEPLAQIIWEQDSKLSLEEIAKDYINPEKEVNTIEDAILKSMDIIAEWISDNADYRKYIRKETFNKGEIVTKAKDEKKESVYEMYYDYREKIKNIPGHRILAINRGEKEKILSVKIEAPVDRILLFLEKQIIKNKDTAFSKILKDSIEDSYKRLIAPAIEREIRNELTEKAETGALNVFKNNLSQLLMQSPIKNKVVLGLDPAFRTGCKIAVIDETGKVLDTTVIYPTPPQNKIEESKEVLKELIDKHKVDIIAIGNGTASRESEMFIAELIKELNRQVHYIIVNEAGASVYSASPLGTEEFPDFDVALRSAVSIGRRLQDPLAELVKIDPKSIGVGQYQHDMNQKRLEEALKGVVEDCVNRVGVDLNTASVSLLQYVAGIKKSVAKNIVEYREANGKFKNRKELLKVKQLGKKVFEQCAGFLRIPESDNLFDRTGVHPESYEVAEKLLNYLGYTKEDIKETKIKNIREKIKDINILAKDLGIGVPTLEDIIKELGKPGRDPREDMPKPILRSDVLELEDLKEGMVLMGTVRNITDFGAFVDIGVHQDGLVHISQITEKFIKHPLDVLSVGDIIKVAVLNVDINKKRIALTMKGI